MTKRRTGRPGKIVAKPIHDFTNTAIQTIPNSIPPLIKRRPGRPRKIEPNIQMQKPDTNFYPTDRYNFSQQTRRPKW